MKIQLRKLVIRIDKSILENKLGGKKTKKIYEKFCEYLPFQKK